MRHSQSCAYAVRPARTVCRQPWNGVSNSMTASASGRLASAKTGSRANDFLPVSRPHELVCIEVVGNLLIQLQSTRIRTGCSTRSDLPLREDAVELHHDVWRGTLALSYLVPSVYLEHETRLLGHHGPAVAIRALRKTFLHTREDACSFLITHSHGIDLQPFDTVLAGRAIELRLFPENKDSE